MHAMYADKCYEEILQQGPTLAMSLETHVSCHLCFFIVVNFDINVNKCFLQFKIFVGYKLITV